MIEKPSPNRIFFDESGNTGQDLLNPDDPIFVLASCSFSLTQEEELFRHFRRFQGGELKFSKLRKYPSGQRSILEFLTDPILSCETASAYWIHKSHMVVTKYCDMVLEPSMREFGIDFYEQGMNIALSNLISMSMPHLLPEDVWKKFLTTYSELVWKRTPAEFRAFKESATTTYRHLEKTAPDFSNYIVSGIMLDEKTFLNQIGATENDPIVPAYYVLADYWGKKKGDWFEMWADESKTLGLERKRLMSLANPKLKPTLQGYDRRKMEFPLKVKEIIPVDSTSQRQVQFADLIAGSLAGSLKPNASPKDQSFGRACLEAIITKGLVAGGIWPSKEISPEELGTDGEVQIGDIDLASYTAMISVGHPDTKM